MNRNTYLANDKNQTLDSHAKITKLVGEHIAKSGGLNKSLVTAIGLAGEFHDIPGKACALHQSNYQGGTDHEVEIRHNERGWAILTLTKALSKLTELKFPDDIFDAKLYECAIASAIFLHHPTKNNKSTHLALLTETENVLEATKYLKSYLSDIYGIDIDINSYIRDNDGKYEICPCQEIPVPKLIEKTQNDVNPLTLAILSVLIKSDRFVSSKSSEYVENALEHWNLHNSLPESVTAEIKSLDTIPDDRLVYSFPDRFIGDRLDNQLKCVDLINNAHSTSIVNGPAGVGKTLIGLMKVIKNGKRHIFAAPTNAIAESLYHNLLEDIDAIGSELRVELYYDGTRQQSNGDEPEFESDIVVTNIDSFMLPLRKNAMAHRMCDVFLGEFVFDEWHMAPNISGSVFALFINIMKCRHIYGTANTALLSATPWEGADSLWEGNGKKTQHLPEKHQHYNAHHTKPYTITRVESEPQHLPGTMTTSSSIKNAQLRVIDGKADVSYTSGLLSQHRNEVMEYLRKHFSKDPCESELPIVSGSPIIRESHNLSFSALHDSLVSMMDLVQTIGRVNRFGNEPSAEITYMICDTDSSEHKSNDLRWGNGKGVHIMRNLMKKSDILLSSITQSVTLDEIYAMFNSFNQNNEESFRKYLLSRYEESMKSLIEFEIRLTRSHNYHSDSEPKTGKTLRNNEYGYYYTAKTSDGEWIAYDMIETKEKYYVEDPAIDFSRLSNIEKIRLMVEIGKVYPEWGKIATNMKSKMKSGKVNNNNQLNNADIIMDNARTRLLPIPIFTSEYIYGKTPNKWLGLVKD